MGTCFVIQPFDQGTFDKRFEDHFAPAIRAAGLEPYRVDRDHGVRVPITSIQEGIKSADACLADITTNNPNVWYELGYALASNKEVILVCSSERSGDFPFDIRHLNIIRYANASGSDFQMLEKNITNQLKTRLAEQQNLQTIASLSPLQEVEGLSPHETATLSILMAEGSTPGAAVSSWFLKQEMERAGFTNIAANLSIASLVKKNMVSILKVESDHSYELIDMYELTPIAIDWLCRNQNQLLLHKETKTKQTVIYDDSDPFADD